MLTLVLAFGMSFGHFGRSDSLKFTLYYRDQCTDSVFITSFYHFKKKGSNVLIKPEPNTGTCVLPATGVYELLFLTVDYPLTYNYNGQAADTLNAPKLFFALPGVDSPLKPHYINCKQNANGRLVDYFKNNIVRAAGKFKNGKLIGKMTYYDLNGKVTGYEYGPNQKVILKN